MPTLPKKLNPEIEFVCADCKRRLPNTARQKNRLLCADRKACRTAMVACIDKQDFARGVTLPQAGG
jgi:hypothetical protein